MLSCCRGRTGQKGKHSLLNPTDPDASIDADASRSVTDVRYQRKPIDDDFVDPSVASLPMSIKPTMKAADTVDHGGRSVSLSVVGALEDKDEIRPTSVVTLRNEPQQQPKQQQQQLTPQSSWIKTREPHEHQHGYSVFQSDENELTIVDSDYSDYESEHEDTVAELPARGGRIVEFGKRSTATLSLVLPRGHHHDQQHDAEAGDEAGSRKRAERLSTFLLAEEDADGDSFGWETLANALVDEEEIIVAANAANASLSPTGKREDDEDEPSARASLLALDQALAVFELAGAETGGGFVESSSATVETRGGSSRIVEDDDDSEEAIVPAASRNSRLI